MPRKALVSLLCVFMFLAALGSCNSPTIFVIQEAGADQQDSTGHDPPGETADADQPDPGDPEEGDNAGAEDAADSDDETDLDDEDDTDDENDPDNVEDPDYGEGSDAGNEPEGGDGSAAGEGQGSDDGSSAGDEPGDDDGDTGAGEQPGDDDGDTGAEDEPGDDGGTGAEDEPDDGDGGTGAGDEPGDDDGGSGAGEGQGGGVALTDSAAVQAYLDGQEENTAATPYPIKVGGINLASNGAGNALKGLYSALSRFVILDLSDSYGEKIINASVASNPNKANITGIILPPGLATVDTNAFADCKNLVSADLREATTVNHGAFSGCKNLETLIVEEATKLENGEGKTDGAFYNCDSLASVSLPKVREIERETFNSCDSLSTVYAPKSMVIGDNAFKACTNLKRLTLGETPPELGASVFADGKPEAIYVPASAVNTYKNTEVAGWTEALKAKVQAIP
jgi:hypothetical protein